MSNNENENVISLAQFVSESREYKGLSQLGFAKKAHLTLQEVEEIESGQVLFLPATTRQKIAKVFKLNTADVQKYEKNFDVLLFNNSQFVQELKELILSDDGSELYCPMCKSKLITKIEKMYDLEDNLILHPKARCSKCPFQIK